MNKLFYIFLSIVLFSGFIFAAGVPTNNITQDSLFNITIKLPNPYYGAIVSDFTNVTNPGSVSESSIVQGAVTNSKLATNSVSESKIQDYSITALKIVANSIGSAHLQDNSVKTNKIVANAVTTDKIAIAAVTKEKISPRAIDYTKLEIYPLGHCPNDNATLLFKKASNGLPDRLEWSASASCNSSSSAGNIVYPATYNYFSSPFNQCIQSVTHKVTGINCTGAECKIDWKVRENLVSSEIISNINNGVSTITVNAGEYNLYYAPYDTSFTLTQPFTGNVIARGQTFSAISRENCQPIQAGSLNRAVMNPTSMPYYRVNGAFYCLDSCKYEVYVDDSYYTEGTFLSTPSAPTNVSVDLKGFSNDYSHKVKFTVTNLGPQGLAGLSMTTSDLILPPIQGGLPG